MKTGIMAREKIAQIACAEIESELQQKQKSFARVKHLTRKPTRWSSGVCKICGEYLDVVTNCHAIKHGYHSAEQMVKENKVYFY